MKKKIFILATGGTIAGCASSKFESVNYKVGDIGIDEILNCVPEIKLLADIKFEQFANIDSKDITEEFLLNIVNRVNELVVDENIAGIVITHGTDTMEETAFLLSLTVASDKPIVLTGAMRPATALSADGPMNLFDAVNVAADDEAIGVLVVMNGMIHTARAITKCHTTSIAAFQSTNSGAIGAIIDGTPIFNYKEIRQNRIFTIKNKLPKVNIIYGHAADDGFFVRAAINAKVDGIVYAGLGNGSIPDVVEIELMNAVNKGIVVVRSSRVSSGCVVSNDENFVNSRYLNPQKARILLQLALMKTRDINEIRNIFQSFN